MISFATVVPAFLSWQARNLRREREKMLTYLVVLATLVVAILAQAILAQAISLQPPVAFAQCGRLWCVVSFAIVRPRSVMPRGRWVFNEELSRALWQQMLRGPRPPSVQWPSRRNDMKKNVPSRPQTDRQPGSSGQPRRWRGRVQRQQPVREVKNPDDDAAALQGRIEKLEKAIEVLGADNPEAKGLVSALKKARAQSQSQLAIGVRLDSCRAFVERAKKRLAGAEEAVTKALSLKSAMEAELEQGLARLQSLREEAAAQPSTTIPDPMELPDDEVSRLRARVAELEHSGRRCRQSSQQILQLQPRR